MELPSAWWLCACQAINARLNCAVCWIDVAVGNVKQILEGGGEGVDLPSGLEGELAGRFGSLEVLDELVHVVRSVEHGECVGK